MTDQQQQIAEEVARTIRQHWAEAELEPAEKEEYRPPAQGQSAEFLAGLDRARRGRRS